MKLKPISWIFLIVGLSQIAFFSCDLLDNNNSPVCLITSPEDGDTLEINSKFIVEVDAYDYDGSIESIMVFINETGYRFTNNFPVQIAVSHADLKTNSCRIRAIAVDDENEIGEDSAIIWFKETSPFEGLPLRDLSGILPNHKVLTNDTIWHIVGNCLIEKGSELFIEPGAIISFAPNEIHDYMGLCIDIEGTLIARGRPEERIVFRPDRLSDGSWGGLMFRGENVDWDTTNSIGSIVEFCEFYRGSDSENRNGPLGTITLEDASPLIKDNIFHNSLVHDLWIYKKWEPTTSALIYGNTFTGYIGIRNDLIFKGNTCDDNGSLDLQNSHEAHIEGNVFRNGGEYAFVKLYDDMSKVRIINNDFSNNEKCIALRWTSDQPIIRNNNFENSEYAVFLELTAIDVDASFNYWGTSDSISIGSVVHDFYDDYKLGKVNYSNFSIEKYQR